MAQRISMPEKRKYNRHLTSRDGILIQGAQRFPCIILDMGPGGSKIFCDKYKVNKQGVSIKLTGGYKSLSASIAWQDESFLGLKYKHSISSLDSLKDRNRFSILNWLRGDRLRAFELFITVITLIYIAVQTTEIKLQNQLQSILKVEDSERFINGLLITNPLLGELSLVGDEESLKKTAKVGMRFKVNMLAYIFLQEWAKMHQIHEKKIMEEDYWESYIKVVKMTAQKPFIKNIINDDKAMTGFRHDFITFLRELNES